MNFSKKNSLLLCDLIILVVNGINMLKAKKAILCGTCFTEMDIAPAVALALANDRLSKKDVFPGQSYINQFLDKPLSNQEYKVLKLLSQGSKNAEIAELLFVSLNTIKTHVSRIYYKLEVNSRASSINKVMNL